MSIVLAHLEQIQREYPAASAELRPDNTAVITVPAVLLPQGGWNCSATTVLFVAPAGYPMANPDCFWADSELRLSTGAMPKNSQVQAPPFGGAQKLWFSWHVSQWSGARDNLRSYFRIILDRLGKPE